MGLESEVTDLTHPCDLSAAVFQTLARTGLWEAQGTGVCDIYQVSPSSPFSVSFLQILNQAFNNVG